MRLEQWPDDVTRERASRRTIITNGERLAGAFALNYARLYFGENTPLERKQVAVDLLGGDVAGGWPFSSAGWYVVRLRESTTEQQLYNALQALQALPQILCASLIML